MIDKDDENYKFWKEIIYKNGELDEEQVMKELDDYKMLLESVSIVYQEVTGGKVSKANTCASDVISVYNDHVEELVREGVIEELGLGNYSPLGCWVCGCNSSAYYPMCFYYCPTCGKKRDIE